MGGSSASFDVKRGIMTGISVGSKREGRSK